MIAKYYVSKLMDAAKAILTGKFIVLNICFRKVFLRTDEMQKE